MTRYTLALLALAPLTALAPLITGCSHDTEAAATAAPKPRPIHVDTITVEERAVPKTALLAGSLKANQESDLAANANGRVMRTMVERGSFVPSGAAIAQLDTRISTLVATEAKANLETARAQKTLAESDCARFQRLKDKDAISQQEYDRVTSGCKTSAEQATAAESRAQQALQNVGDATVRAPFAGLIAERYVSAGEYVRADTKVVHLVDIDPLRLELTIPEADIGSVKMGQKVDFQVAAFPERRFQGTVRYIGPSVRSATRDLVFEALVPNREKLLRPGLFATARLDVGTQKLPVVPAASLRKDGDTLRAFVIVEKHLEERVVQPGPIEGERVAIISGVSAGERIVARPTEQIADGMDVE
ncbi:MAG TPA: efflux RND transporter periplasmic adaptor subunit [Polyangia bacterium]|nr:efflux RND transporter periplasmic adaptor subunit [Polyangia bacterium]